MVCAGNRVWIGGSEGQELAKESFDILHHISVRLFHSKIIASALFHCGGASTIETKPCFLSIYAEFEPENSQRRVFSTRNLALNDVQL
jgi:hypothetical protein